jgi:hypothetical protein
MTLELDLRSAIGALDDSRIAELVPDADGALLDAILEGVRVHDHVVVPNKLFGKGTRGAKKRAFDRRLRDVIGLAGPTSTIASALKRTEWLWVLGEGGEVLDVGSLGAWTGLRSLELRGGGRVRGLDRLCQVARLKLYEVTSVDLAEIAALPALDELSLDAKELVNGAALARGRKLPKVHLVAETAAAATSIPPLRAEKASVLTSDRVAAERFDGDAIGPIHGEMDELHVLSGSAVRTLRLGDVRGLERFVLQTPALVTVEGGEALSTLRFADVEGAFADLEILRHATGIEELRVDSPLRDLSTLGRMKGLRALYLTGHEPTSTLASFEGTKRLALDRLGLHARTFQTGRIEPQAWKYILRDVRPLKALSLRTHLIDSLDELPAMPTLLELDLSYCHGDLDLTPALRLFPMLRRLVLTGTGMRASEVPAGLAKAGVEIVR